MAAEAEAEAAATEKVDLPLLAYRRKNQLGIQKMKDRVKAREKGKR